MRIEMTFDRQKVERQGWTMEAVQETVRKNFEARGLRCVTENAAIERRKSGMQNFVNKKGTESVPFFVVGGGSVALFAIHDVACRSAVDVVDDAFCDVPDIL